MNKSFRFFLFCAVIIHFSISVSGQINYPNCFNAKFLCDKSPITLNELPENGNLQVVDLGPCFPNDFQETNAVWFIWKAAEAGSLSFTILPINETDDLDFALYQLNNPENCDSKSIIRCMAAGPNLGQEAGLAQNCSGATGLRDIYEEESQGKGCPKDGKNFLSPVEMLEGKYYLLFVNNFRSSSGILIEWGGTATFEPMSEECKYLPTTTSTLIDNGTGIQFSEPFPNPTTENVQINAVTTQISSGQLQIIGSDGQLEMSQAFELAMGSNTIDLPTHTLRNGIHFIKLRTNGKSHICRFVKN